MVVCSGVARTPWSSLTCLAKLMAKGWLEGKPRMSQWFVDCHLPCCLVHLVGFSCPSRQPWLTIQQPLPLLSEDHPVLLERPAVYFSSEVCPVGVQSDKGVFSHVTLVRVQGSGARVVECLEGNDRLFGHLYLPAQSASPTSVPQRHPPAVEWDRIAWA